MADERKEEDKEYDEVELAASNATQEDTLAEAPPKKGRKSGTPVSRATPVKGGTSKAGTPLKGDSIKRKASVESEASRKK